MTARSGAFWLRALSRRLRSRYRTEICLGTQEARGYLHLRGAEADTLSDENGSTILFGSETPSTSAVLEEVAHVLQHEQASFGECDLQEMIYRREIEAKECLVRGQARFGIPPHEHLETLTQLEAYRRRLEEIERWTS